MNSTSKALLTVLSAAIAVWPLQGFAALHSGDDARDVTRQDMLQNLDILLAQAAGPAPARQAPTPTPTQTAPSGSHGGTLTPGESLNQVTTGRVTKDLAAAVAECRQYEDVYRIDCLRQNIERTANALPDTGDYSEAKRILSRTASRLGAIVNTYADTSVPRLVPEPNANPRNPKKRVYRAVRKDKLKQAMAEATRVIEEAQTELLRSGENSQARLVHYTAMATAVGSTKVLLRSS